jgi:hypothetical protein
VNDIDDVLLQARDSLSGAHMGTPVEAILARSRSRRQRRRLAELSVAGVAASVALVLGLTGVFGSSNHSPEIRTAAFTLVSNANGTATLTLHQSQVFNPSALAHALAQAGIPAVVHTGIFCSSHPAPPSKGVISVQLPGGASVAKSYPGHERSTPPDAVTVINPAAMPAGTELSLTFLHHNRDLDVSDSGPLIYEYGHTCGPDSTGH